MKVFYNTNCIHYKMNSIIIITYYRTVGITSLLATESRSSNAKLIFISHTNKVVLWPELIYFLNIVLKALIGMLLSSWLMVMYAAWFDL